MIPPLKSFEIGEPDSDGFYVPVFITHYDDNPLPKLRDRIDALYARNLPFRSAAYRRGWERALDAVLELLP